MQSLESKNAPVFSPLLRKYTLQEFWALPVPEDRYHYDLIGGFLFMVPPPAPPHGRIDSRLNRSLVGHLIEHKLKGEVHHPHEPIYRSSESPTYLEPDMMYVSQELSETMGDKRTSADIVFEYASRSTAIYDRTTKADTYLALGVRELWIIDSSRKLSKCDTPPLKQTVATGISLCIRKRIALNQSCWQVGWYLLASYSLG